MILLKTAGDALTTRFAPRPARTMDQRFRAFASTTLMVLFFPRKRCARSGSRSPHQTVCPWRSSSCASKEPVPPAPRTKIRIGSQLYHILPAAQRRETRMDYPLSAAIVRIREALMTPAGETAIRGEAALISARLDRLPTTRYIWKLLLMLSLGGCFEFYDLFLMTYIGPGLTRSGLFTAASVSFFGLTGLASFVSATFAGLFIGTVAFGFMADKFGRRTIFTYSLLWYTASSVVMACQS